MTERPKSAQGRLCWRHVDGEEGVMHCFRLKHKPSIGPWLSLCGDWIIPRKGGNLCGRPPRVLRCNPCDVREAKLLHSDVSMPETEDWTLVGVEYTDAED